MIKITNYSSWALLADLYVVDIVDGNLGVTVYVINIGAICILRLSMIRQMS